MSVKIPDLHDDKTLRFVEFDGYRLHTWDTYRTDRRGKYTLGYAMYKPGAAEPLFAGEDFHCAPGNAVDSNAALRCLLGFLTLRPGDTDEEYFGDYTEEQMEFAQTSAEELCIWGMEEESFRQDGEEPPHFKDLLDELD